MDKSKCLLDILEEILSNFPNLQRGYFSIDFAGDNANELAQEMFWLLGYEYGYNPGTFIYYHKEYVLSIVSGDPLLPYMYQIGIYRSRSFSE